MIKKNVDGITKTFIERVSKNFDLTMEEATMFTTLFFHTIMEEMVTEGFVSAPVIGQIRTSTLSLLGDRWCWYVEPTKMYKEQVLAKGLVRRTRRSKQKLMRRFNEKTRSCAELMAEFDQTKEY